MTGIVLTFVNINLAKNSDNHFVISNAEALAGGEGGSIEIKCCPGLIGGCPSNKDKKGPEITCEFEW